MHLRHLLAELLSSLCLLAGLLSKPPTHRPPSSSKGQWERRLQTDINLARRALREALTPLDDVKPPSLSQSPQPEAAAGTAGGGGGVDSPASSSSGASQCSPSGPYVLTADNISRMLDSWVPSGKGRRGGSSPDTPGGAESASGSSDASEVSYGGAAAPAAGPISEYETKPAVPAQHTQLSAIESWLFEDDSSFHHVQSGSMLDVSMDYQF